MLSTTVSLDIDVVSAKISLNDVVLANSILSRAHIANRGGVEGATGNATATATVTRGRSSTTSSISPVPSSPVPDISTPSRTVYDFVAQLGSISLVAINDFNGQNLPILRLSVERSDFRAGGQMTDLQGEGSFQVKAEYYNTRVAVWEPFIELWGPQLFFVSSLAGTVVEAVSGSTLQVDVSGAMLRTFSQVTNLIYTVLEEFEAATPHRKQKHLTPNGRRASERRKSVSAVRAMITDTSLARGTGSSVTFKNCLEFPIEIFDSVTRESLAVLRAGESAPLLTPGVLSRSWIQSQGKRPSLFDVHVLGRLKEQRKPLLQLPLNVNKPRPYCLQPNLTSGAGGLGCVKGSDRTRGAEPIVEEAYENQRYSPLENQWSKPWPDLNDPPTWTDALGCGPRNPSSIHLPSDRWEWIEGDWKVDISGVVDMEIDEKGWEYATNFTSFSVSKKRRTKMPMDVTRRRRWTRSRMSKSSASDELLRPLIVMWDVKSLLDGSRMAVVRSGLQVKNLMPFPLSVAVDGFPGKAPSLAFNRLEEGDQDSRPPERDVPCKPGSVGRTGGLTARVFDNIPAGETFSLPLLLSGATVMRFKPSGDTYGWSRTMACRPNNCSSTLEGFSGNGSVGDKDGQSGGRDKQGEREKESETNQSHLRLVSTPDGSLLSARDYHHLSCPVTTHTGSGSGVDQGSALSSVCAQGMVLAADRSRMVAFVPYAVCHNLLPCDLSYRFIGGDGHTEEVSRNLFISFLSLSFSLFLSVSLSLSLSLSLSFFLYFNLNCIHQRARRSILGLLFHAVLILFTMRFVQFNLPVYLK